MFVFGMSAGMAITVVGRVLEANISSVTFGYIITGWLAIVFAFFAFPLLAFSKPLSELKEKSAEVLGAQATRYHRAAERSPRRPQPRRRRRQRKPQLPRLRIRRRNSPLHASCRSFS